MQNNHQSPSVSMQDLTLWGKDDHEKSEDHPRTTRKELVNDLNKAEGTTGNKQKMITHYAAMDWNPAAPAMSPFSRKHMYRPAWSLPMSI